LISLPRPRRAVESGLPLIGTGSGNRRLQPFDPADQRFDLLAYGRRQHLPGIRGLLSSSVGPVFFTVFADRNVPGQVTDDVLKKVISTVRPYSCPAGTRPQRNNRCA
jgi:hypothetical protein